jgi:hypothetical protein
MLFTLSFMKIHQLIEKLLVGRGEGNHTDMMIQQVYLSFQK